jgi:hypothetical protein
MTIRDKYGKSLAARHQELRSQSDQFLKISTNAGKLLNRLGGLVEVDVPRQSDGNRINLYLYGDAANGDRATATARIEKVLGCTFDSKGVAENVKLSRIRATVTLRVKRERKQRKAA